MEWVEKNQRMTKEKRKATVSSRDFVLHARKKYLNTQKNCP
jgi:hypothetical protein